MPFVRTGIEPDEYLLTDEYDSTLRVGMWAGIAFTPNRYASLGVIQIEHSVFCRPSTFPFESLNH
jgi:hypothetical protein